jgi:NADH-quinone oxidoreductase subunit K
LIDGQIATLFVIVLAAAEAAIAIAIFVNYYRALATIDVDQGDQLRG